MRTITGYGRYTVNVKDDECFKYGCPNGIETWELECGEGVETFPSGLCIDHAQRPDKRGTVHEPTIIRVRS